MLPSISERRGYAVRSANVQYDEHPFIPVPTQVDKAHPKMDILLIYSTYHGRWIILHGVNSLVTVPKAAKVLSLVCKWYIHV